MIRIPSDIELLQYLEGGLGGLASRRVAKAIAVSNAAERSYSEVKKDLELCERLREIIQADISEAEAESLEQRFRDAVSSSLG